MSQQAPPSVAPSGEDAIHREITAEPEALTDDALDLAQAYEVDLTLAEIEKGGYQRVRTRLELLYVAAVDPPEADTTADRLPSSSPTSSCTMRSRSTAL